MRTDYEHLADRYDEDRARWSFPRDDLVERLLGARAAVRVVDLGCGTGRWLAAQRELLGGLPVELLGVDPSAAMLGRARAKGLTSLARASAEDLPLADASIDYVVCSYAFHHFGDKDRALDEMSRVLSIGGVLRINNFEPTSAKGGWLYEFFPATMAIDAARFWPPERIADALEHRHLSIDVHIEAGTEQMPAAEVLTDALRRVVSQLALLDDEQYRRGLARLRQAAQNPEATITSVRSQLCLTATRNT